MILSWHQRLHKEQERAVKEDSIIRHLLHLFAPQWELHHYMAPFFPHHSCYIATSGDSDLIFSAKPLERVGSTRATFGKMREEFSQKGDFISSRKWTKNRHKVSLLKTQILSAKYQQHIRICFYSKTVFLM